MTECPQIALTHALADGELAGVEAAAARDHVAVCAQCQAELADVMHLSGLPVSPSVGGASAGGVVSLAWYRRRALQGVAVAMSLAAGVALYVASSRREFTIEAPRVALAPQRSFEARLAWSGASEYRAYSVSRAGDATLESISLDALAKVEKRGDLHGVGVLALLSGDRKQAASFLARAGDSPAVLADRAALALVNSDPAAAVALADQALERIAVDRGKADRSGNRTSVARMAGESAAMWNRGLALRELGLSHAAAAAFRSVASGGEQGWAEEAKQRAAMLDTEGTQQLDRALRVAAAAKTLAATFEGLAVEDARALPGSARSALYDAIRAAPTQAALAQLRLLAEAIDAVDHTTTAVAALARQPNAKLASGYAAMLAGNPPPAGFLAALRAANASDLLIGALQRLGDGRNVRLGDLAEFVRLTAASPDPWITLLGLEQQAAAAMVRDDLAAAESSLLRAAAICSTGGPTYRCIRTALLTGQIYLKLGRISDAKVALDDAWRRARASLEWEQQGDVLQQLAALASNATGSGTSLARAYAGEIAARDALLQTRRSGNRQ